MCIAAYPSTNSRANRRYGILQVRHRGSVVATEDYTHNVRVTSELRAYDDHTHLFALSIEPDFDNAGFGNVSKYCLNIEPKGSSDYITGLRVSLENSNMSSYGIFVSTNGSTPGIVAGQNGSGRAIEGLGYGANSVGGFFEGQGFALKTGTGKVYFQNNVGIGTESPNAAALLQIDSTSKGFLPPRMTTAQRNGISTPPEGLIIYNRSTHKVQFYNGSTWGDL